MNNKILYIIVAILVLVGVGFYVYSDKQKAPVVDNSQNAAAPVAQQPSDANTVATSTAPATSTASNPTSSQDKSHFSDEADATGQAQVRQVTYDGTSFNPPSLTIKAGDIVVFKNQSSSDFWPASNPHPTHTDYPEFNAKQKISAGSDYQFKFLKVGTWGYHNHLNHSVGGTIIVTQ